MDQEVTGMIAMEQAAGILTMEQVAVIPTMMKAIAISEKSADGGGSDSRAAQIYETSFQQTHSLLIKYKYHNGN